MFGTTEKQAASRYTSMRCSLRTLPLLEKDFYPEGISLAEKCYEFITGVDEFMTARNVQSSGGCHQNVTILYA
jgi:hypothetical protein